jgi:1-deoxy-D-xylulose-5-phosphate reductoisomerase
MKKIALLGSTGSIGRQTLSILAKHPDRFKAVALSAGSNVEMLAQQIVRYEPEIASLRTKADAEKLKSLGDFPHTEILWGEEGIVAAATCDSAEMVLTAVVGAAGLVPTWRAIEAGKDIALANKETLVCAGALFMEKVKKAGVALIPVDSEHSAIFQSLAGNNHGELSKILLTASGGPFRGKTSADLENVTPEDALNHPNWDMGPKITIDSSTLMNKGLEVIEARWLFDAPPEMIEVVVHPQSIVHSMVEYRDGQVIAQLGSPDMRGPIAYALSYPERLDEVIPSLDLAKIGSLTFEHADTKTFPCLALAFQALAGPASAPAALNAANEVAVQSFLDRKIRFADIPRTLEHVLGTVEHGPLSDLEQVVAADAQGRRVAQVFVEKIGS